MLYSKIRYIYIQLILKPYMVFLLPMKICRIVLCVPILYLFLFTTRTTELKIIII
jgi:hypothetical protein